MKWQATYFCVKCDGQMSFDTKMNSKGICPYCGNVEAGTIVKCYKRAARFIRRSPRWKFWDNKGHWEITKGVEKCQI